MHARLKGEIIPGNLQRLVRNQEGATGLESAIILLSFLVLAAVFSFTILSAGIFVSQKNSSSIHAGLREAQSSLAMEGNPIAMDTDQDGDVDRITFTLVNALGGEPINLTEPTDTNTVADTLEFDTAQGKEPDIIHVSGNIYAIAYKGSNDHGLLKTVEISPGGAITNTVIDTLEFDTTKAKKPRIIHVNDDIYAIAYEDTNGHGLLKTVEILPGGAITDTVIDTLEFDTTKGKEAEIIQVSGNIYAIAYQGDGDDGFLKTVEISPGGAITDTVVDTLEFDTVKAKKPRIIHVNDDIYVIAYEDTNGHGLLKTVEISPGGAITNTVIDTLEFDTTQGKEPDITPVSGNIYAVAYKGVDDDGFLKTIEISPGGAITDTVVDTLEFDTAKATKPRIIHVIVSDNIYVIAYEDTNGHGLLKTVEISPGGAITDSVIDTLEFDTTRGKEPDIIHVNGDYHAIAYKGADDDGFLKTVEISSNGAISTIIGDDLADEGSNHVLVISYKDATTMLSDLAWTKVMLGSNDGDNLLEENEKARITVELTATSAIVDKGHSFTLEILPPGGAVLVIERTTPPVIDKVTQLRD